MTYETARHILHALLAEKGIALPTLGAGNASRDQDATIRLLLESILSAEASGALPEDLARALAETFDAAAIVNNGTAAEGTIETN